MLAAVAEAGVLLTFQTLPALCKVTEQHHSLHRENVGLTAAAWGPAQEGLAGPKSHRGGSCPTFLREAQTPTSRARRRQVLTLAVPVAQLLAGHERRLAEDGVGHPSRAQRFSCH